MVCMLIPLQNDFGRLAEQPDSRDQQHHAGCNDGAKLGLGGAFVTYFNERMHRAGCNVDKCNGTDQQTGEHDEVLRVAFDLAYQSSTNARFRRFNGWHIGQCRFAGHPGHTQLGTQRIT